MSMYVGVCIYEYVCICMYEYVCMIMYVWVCMYEYVCMSMHACMVACMIMYVCMYGCMDVCMYLCIYVSMYVSMYLCMYLCIYVCICICICICNFKYVCTHTSTITFHSWHPFSVVSRVYDKKISRFSASCLWQASDCMAGTVGCKLLWRASAKFEPKQLQGKVDIRLVMACQSVMMSRCTSATSDVFYM